MDELYDPKKEYICPTCGEVLEVDEEQMADDYGFALWDGTLTLKAVVFWCNNCDSDVSLP